MLIRKRTNAGPGEFLLLELRFFGDLPISFPALLITRSSWALKDGQRTSLLERPTPIFTFPFALNHFGKSFVFRSDKHVKFVSPSLLQDLRSDKFSLDLQLWLACNIRPRPIHSGDSEATCPFWNIVPIKTLVERLGRSLLHHLSKF